MLSGVRYPTLPYPFKVIEEKKKKKKGICSFVHVTDSILRRVKEKPTNGMTSLFLVSSFV